jgi:phenylalanyl-tRNA synthetase beta chain
MNASYEWLKDFCPFTMTPAELRDRLTEVCATVEELTPVRSDLAPIVVARVVEAKPHPDSDHLSVTRVDDGSGTLLDVVCGAPNVAAGRAYPFARVGVTLPGGLKLERRKIRGAMSNGMLCSARELGLGEEHDGILELDTAAAPGTPFLDAVQVGDTRLGIDVLPNRGDLLSHLGLAREIAASSGVSLRMPAIPGDAGVAPPAPVAARGEVRTAGFTIRVDDESGAPRYMAAIIRGVKVGPSPAWIVERLRAVGSRSINNVVDATNYMLHGFGQPMHAFDAARLGGSTVLVRRARPGERIVTLDGVDRALDESMTVIADADRAQAIAGVIGGRESEVTDATTDILLEVAAFDPKRVRRTRRALGLSTDASYRFERGTDIRNAGEALAHAVRLLVAVAGGSIDGAPADVGAPMVPSPAITLRPARASRLVGVDVSAERITAMLRPIGFAVERQGDALSVTAPSWRRDVLGEIDLIEEVARLYGYDALPSEVRPNRVGNVPDAPLDVLAKRLRAVLSAAGLLEARPMPFVAGNDATHIRVANPLAENEAHLRRSVLETLARRAEFNLSHMLGNVRLYELGSVFEKRAQPMPREVFTAGILVMGDRRPSHFTDAQPPSYDAWDAKALAELTSREIWPGAEVALRSASEEASADGGLLWEVVVDAAPRGWVRRLTLDAPVWAAPAFGVELAIADIENDAVAPPGRSSYESAPAPRARVAPKYSPLPVTPAAPVDLALIVPESTPASEVEAVIRRAAGDLLEQLALFDEFRGPGVPPGHRSLAWRLTFRDPTRTLRDKEVEGRTQKILRTLEGELGVRQRTA